MIKLEIHAKEKR